MTTARFEGPQGGAVTATLISTPPGSKPEGETVLYGCVYDSNGLASRVIVQVKKTTCGCDQKPGGISSETMVKIDRAVKEANDYVRKQVVNATNVRVNYTSLALKYKDNGVDKSLSVSKIQDTALRNLILDGAKDLEHKKTTDPSIDSNRPMNRSSSLEINDQRWWNIHHVSPRDFAHEQHANLDAALRANPETRDLADTALLKVKAASQLIDQFAFYLQEKLRAKEVDLATLKTDQRREKLAKINQIRELRKLLEKLALEKLDTKAIYRSVPYANDDLQGFANLQEQLKRADLSRDQEQTDLATLHLGKLPKKVTFWNAHPNPVFVKAYANDKGDLLVHERFDYENRVDDRGGEKRGPSIEEFIVFNILNLKSDDMTTIPDALDSLALPKHNAEDQELRDLVFDALLSARKIVRTEYDSNRMAPPTRSLDEQREVLFP